MAQTTKIEWTDVSWNPTHGCSRVSTGCKHCYAETLSLRYGQTLKPWTAVNAAENVLLKPHKLREPLSKAGPWKNPCRVFVNSMSDLFHEQIPDKYIAAVFATMACAPQHTFQVLTKRPERMLTVLSEPAFESAVFAEAIRLAQLGHGPRCEWPLPNVWLGVSIENRKWVGRADVLRETPAAVRFISAEPLLGPLLPDGATCIDVEHVEYDRWDAPYHAWPTWADEYDGPGLNLEGIDWLIVGGESGSGHRPFDPDWARALATYCADECWQDADGQTAFFMKQMGGSRPGTALEDLPEDLRIREFPAVRS